MDARRLQLLNDDYNSGALTKDEYELAVNYSIDEIKRAAEEHQQELDKLLKRFKRDTFELFIVVALILIGSINMFYPLYALKVVYVIALIWMVKVDIVLLSRMVKKDHPIFLKISLFGSTLWMVYMLGVAVSRLF